MFSYVRTSITAVLSSLFQSTPALPPAQQSIAHSTGSSIGSSQVDCNGAILLTAVAIRRKLVSAISRGDFQKVKECIKEIEYEQIKNEVLNYERYYMKPIHHATLLGNLKILEFLCNSGADVNTTISNRYLSTPLHIAARHDKLEIAKFLLDRDANINATNYKGFTPLYLASDHCHLNMVKLLLCKGADASIQSQYGKTA
nr:unnamed protein product [Callosobruchus chinensis]